MSTRDKRTAEEKKRLFAAEYLANGRNATAAALALGYSPTGAKQYASRLLKDPIVREIIDKATKKTERKLELTKERVLEQYMKIAFADVKDYYTVDKDGKKVLKPWDEIDGTVIDSIEKIYGTSGRSDIKVKLRNQADALEKLFKYLGMDKTTLNLNADVSLASVLLGVHERLKQAGGGDDEPGA